MNVNNLKDRVEEGYSKADPNPLDMEIGKKIKELRLIRGMSQDDLGKKVGITFQQIQKYEKGVNRVLVSRLCDLAVALSTNISYFFSGIPNMLPNMLNVDHNDAPMYSESTALHEDQNSFEHKNSDSDAESKEILVLVREYRKINNKKSRQAVYSLIKSLSSS